MSTATPERVTIAQQPMRKIACLATDAPEFIQRQFANMPHYPADSTTPEADAYTSVGGTTYDRRTTEGPNRETLTLTGAAIIDADRYVARVQVNYGSTTWFYPVVAGTHYCSDHTMRTKAAAFTWLSEQETRIDRTELDLLNCDLDDTDRAILHGIVDAWEQQIGPRVGDYVRFPDRAPLHRFSHDHDEHGLQTATGGSFHIGTVGASYSGSLDRTRRRETLSATGETKPARFWFFHHGRPAAGNGVDVRIPARVFTCSEPFDTRS